MIGLPARYCSIEISLIFSTENYAEVYHERSLA